MKLDGDPEDRSNVALWPTSDFGQYGILKNYKLKTAIIESLISIWCLKWQTSISTFKTHRISEDLKKQMIEKRVHSLSKSDDQERTQFLKMVVKEWAHSFFSDEWELSQSQKINEQ